MSATTTLPHWDMTPIFPSLESPEFASGMQATSQHVADLAALFDTEAIQAQEGLAVDDALVARYERVTAQINATLEELRTISAYISAFVTTNTRDTLAQARASELQRESVRFSQLMTRFTAWIGSLNVDALVARSSVARDHTFALQKARVAAAHLMSPDEEALASELNVPGGSAWGKLHGNVTSQLTAPVVTQGKTEDLPLSVIRNLAFDTDRETRRAAYEAELVGWERIATPITAALNSIKGQGNILSERRGWETPLDAALFDAHIDRQTLDAMLGAARESFPEFRRYLKAKARALGIPMLAWYDLFAPVGGSGKTWTYEDARSFIEEQFGTFSPRLRDYAARAFRENWIDAEPRPGKQDGAYCMWVRRDESRVFSNFKPAFGGMSTLAHELGHGYHNMLLASRTMLQRDTPMTLAETASIFCETIVRNAALRQVDAHERIEILEASLQGSCQVVVDITSRFLFEQAVFEGRRKRELSTQELNDLMQDAQKQTYGDGLDPEKLHPYMWIVKPHYYSASRSFYNFPYMFGLLFGLGLYARYQADPTVFTARYDNLLSSTGLADAATLAAQFEIDVRQPDFWRGSLRVIRDEVDQFEAAIKSIERPS